MSNEEFTIYFIKSDDYKLIPSNGIWGGLTPRGDILVDFFVESNIPPSSITYCVESNEDLVKLNELKREGEKKVRELKVGILLSPTHAYSVGKFLLEKAKQAGFPGDKDE